MKDNRLINKIQLLQAENIHLETYIGKLKEEIKTRKEIHIELYEAYQKALKEIEKLRGLDS